MELPARRRCYGVCFPVSLVYLLQHFASTDVLTSQFKHWLEISEAATPLH
jgi:hypothetical protein